VSWIHLDDIVSLYLFALHESTVKGPVNAVAPHPVTNAEFTKALARAVRRPAILPAPSIALKLALGEMSSLLLESQRVKEGFSERGFRFRYPELGQALEEIVS
jgi:NAD dependent epimerase/dehydratase family enzyme